MLRKAPKQLNGIGSANGLPSPVTPADTDMKGETASTNGSLHFNSPSRKVGQLLRLGCSMVKRAQAKKVISYAESGDEEDEDDVFNPSLSSRRKGRALKRRRTSPSPEADEFVGDIESEPDFIDEGKPPMPPRIIDKLLRCVEKTASS